MATGQFKKTGEAVSVWNKTDQMVKQKAKLRFLGAAIFRFDTESNRCYACAVVDSRFLKWHSINNTQMTTNPKLSRPATISHCSTLLNIATIMQRSRNTYKRKLKKNASKIRWRPTFIYSNSF